MSDSVVQSHLAILLSPASLLLCVSWQIYDLRGPLRLFLHLPTFLIKHINLTMLHCNACSMLQCWTLRLKKKLYLMLVWFEGGGGDGGDCFAADNKPHIKIQISDNIDDA